MNTPRNFTLGAFCLGVLIALLFPGNAKAQDSTSSTAWVGSPAKRVRDNEYGSSSSSQSGINGACNATASYGYASATAYSYPAAYPNTFGYADASGSWNDTITIQPDNPALLGKSGTANFTYYVNGQASSTDYQVAQFNVVTECGCGGPGTYEGTPINSSFTITRQFTFGSPFQIYMSLGVLSHGYTAANITASLAAGGYTVVDSGNSPAGYSATSTMGTARSMVFTNGTPYAGFALTNTVGNQTTAALLAGTTVNSNETLVGQFSGPEGTNGIVSDVLDFSGTFTNLFALAMSYNPLAAIAQFGSETNVSLQYFDPLALLWTNAIHGNSDGGANGNFFVAAFDAAKFALGNWGVDTNQHLVWAVLDHNSRFAAGGAFTPAFRMDGATMTTNGLSISVLGPSGGQFFIDAVSDLNNTNWTALGRAIPDPNGVATFLDPAATNNLQRFYRAHQ